MILIGDQFKIRNSRQTLKLNNKTFRIYKTNEVGGARNDLLYPLKENNRITLLSNNKFNLNLSTLINIRLNIISAEVRAKVLNNESSASP